MTQVPTETATTTEATLRAEIHAGIDQLANTDTLWMLWSIVYSHLDVERHPSGGLSDEQIARHERSMAEYRRTGVSYSSEEVRAILKARRA